jgi:hypothetical protein
MVYITSAKFSTSRDSLCNLSPVFSNLMKYDYPNKKTFLQSVVTVFCFLHVSIISIGYLRFTFIPTDF